LDRGRHTGDPDHEGDPIMPTYTARFRTDATWATETFEAASAAAALTLARAFKDECTDALVFQDYDENSPVTEITITDSDGNACEGWMDDELRFSLSGEVLLEALELALERLEINNHAGEETPHIAQVKAAITKVTGIPPS
jgi:hypothetical protein